MKHKISNRYLSQSSVCDDIPRAWDHRLVLKEFAKEQSLVMQLRAIVLPALKMEQSSELVSQMFESILDCSSKAIAELQHCLSDAQAPAVDMLDDKKTVQRISNDSIDNNTRPQHHHQNKRSIKRVAESMSFETPVPYYDGHQWRKYGQKEINGAKYPRSYYRCTYRKEQGCKATKTVQQYDPVTDNGGRDHAMMYTAIYYGWHTCNFNDNDSGISAGNDNNVERNTQRNHDHVHYNNNQRSIVSVSFSYPDDDQQTFLGDNVHFDNNNAEISRNINMDWQLDPIESVQLDFDNWDWE
ncbi:unnamed protein product [Urochloa humidicola]